MPHRLQRAAMVLFASALAAGSMTACGARSQDRALAPPGSGLAGELSCVGVGPAPPSLPGAVSRTYKSASGRDLRVHVLQPSAAGTGRPAILFFFGGGWRRGEATQFLGQAQAAAARGYVAVLADYRVACRDKTGVLDAVADAQDAYAWLRREAMGLGVDPARIVLAGGSAGGQLALVSALSAPERDRPAALVLFNPAVDLVAISKVVGLSADQARPVSPTAMDLSAAPPMKIFHGQADRLVPIESVRTFCSKAEAIGRRCELHEYPGQGHGFFNSHAKDAALGFAPYDDTLARMFAFLDGLGLEPPGWGGAV